MEDFRVLLLIVFMKGFVEPLQRVRKDWPVIDIKDADHLNYIFKPQFKEEIQKWLARQAQH